MESESLELQPRIRQETLLAPQLRASLRVLQMDHLSLKAEVQHEAEINPVVELGRDDDMPVVSEELANVERREDELEPLAHEDEANLSGNVDEEAAERRQRFFDRQVAEESLQEHLLAQIASAGLSEGDAQLAEFLIGDIDDDGRYVGLFEDLTSVLGVADADLERVLKAIQQFDPPGVGARNLRECLRIQAEQSDVTPDVREALLDLIEQHLADAAEKTPAQLATCLNLPQALCDAALAALRALEPKPGRPYQAHGRHTQYIQPELTVAQQGDGIVLQSCASDMPVLRISPFYQAMLADPNTTRETQVYLRERIGSAERLQEAIARRGETVMRIAEVVFSVQNEFFKKGFDALRPLTIEEVAHKTGYHGTTVGRAVRGKYVRTPHGVFELKQFFCVGKLACENEIVSAVAAKRLLVQLIRSDAGLSMTDDDLAHALSREGVRISRRTVAKYRSELGIPAASERGRRSA